MFGTFRFNQKTNDHEHIEISRADGLEARGYTRVACKSCRARKLKCSGDKSGCRRCRSLSQKCVYKSNPSDGSGSTVRRPSVTSPGEQASRPSGSKTQERSASPAAASPVSAPLSPSGSLSPACFYDESGDLDMHAADPSLFISPDDAGVACMQGSTDALEPDGDGSVSGAAIFEPGRRAAHEPNWSLSSSKAGLCLGLEDTVSPLTSNDNRDYDAELNALLMPDTHLPPFPQSKTPRAGGHAAWDLDMDLGAATALSQHLPAEDPRGPAGFGADADLALRSAGMMLPSPETSSRASSIRAKSQSVSAGSTASRGTCQCLRAMAQFLESMDAQGDGTDAENEDLGVDMLLISLGRGMKTCEGVLACERCNACAENGIIVATLGQQLGSAAESAARKVIAHGRQLQLAAGTPHSRSSQAAGDDVLDGDICFGRYKVTSPKMGLLLTRHAVRLHVAELRTLLGRIKESMLRNRGARKLLLEVEAKVTRIHDVLRQTPAG